MKKSLVIVIVLALLLLPVLSGCKSANTITIGSKDFTENIILSEIFAQIIEHDTDLKVNRKSNLGGTFVCFEAIKNGEIDIYPEYTGTGLTAQLKMDVINDSEKTYQIVSEEFDKQFDIKWLYPLGFNNTYAIAVKSSLADQYKLVKCSDLPAISGNLVFGAEHEFFNRQDGYDGFIEKYGITFKDTAKMNVSLKYQAIGNDQMDVTDAFSTDGQIKQYDLRLLEDDLGFFPPYYAAPIVRNETLAAHPGIETALNKLAGQLNDEEMMLLNYKADVEKQDIAKIAKEFLESKGLIA